MKSHQITQITPPALKKIYNYSLQIIGVGRNTYSPFSPSSLSPKAFTLVELIVVITILAILGTVGFISLQGYSSKSRDSNRATNLSLAARSLETYQVNASKYPTPDSISGTGQIGGVTVAVSGMFGDTVAPLVKMDKAPKDPVSSSNLAYGVDASNSQYQIAATMESSLAFDVRERDLYAFGPVVEFEEGVYAVAEGGYMVAEGEGEITTNTSRSRSVLLDTLGETALPTVHAAGTPVARVAGNYKGVTKTGSSIYNPPSLIFASGSAFVAGGVVDLTNTNIRFVTNNGTNLPYSIAGVSQGSTTPVQALAAVGSTAGSLTGVTITDWSTQSGSLATSLGVSKDTIGMVYYGTKDYSKVQGGGSVASGGGPVAKSWKTNTSGNKCCSNWNHTNATYTIGGIDTAQKCLDWTTLNEPSNNQVSWYGAPYNQCIRCNGTVDFNYGGCSAGYQNYVYE